jgi:NitT/TauT family transport system permease protein
MYTKRNKWIYIIYPLLSFVTIVVLWMLADIVFNIREVILPNPLEILEAFASNYMFLLKHTLITFFEAFVGFIIGALFGFCLASIFAYSPFLRKSFLPHAIAFRATPSYALAPLFVLWFGNTLLPKIVLAAVICTFPILISSIKGLTSVDEQLLELFTSFGATPFQKVLYLKIPYALPHVFAGLKIGTTMALLGAMFAEFSGASQGIGFVIVRASYYIDTSLMFAAIVSISIVGIVFFYIIQYIERKVVFWQSDSKHNSLQ